LDLTTEEKRKVVVQRSYVSIGERQREKKKGTGRGRSWEKEYFASFRQSGRLGEAAYRQNMEGPNTTFSEGPRTELEKESKGRKTIKKQVDQKHPAGARPLMKGIIGKNDSRKEGGGQ